MSRLIPSMLQGIFWYHILNVYSKYPNVRDSDQGMTTSMDSRLKYTIYTDIDRLSQAND